jgi:hypothetical protein
MSVAPLLARLRVRAVPRPWASQTTTCERQIRDSIQVKFGSVDVRPEKRLISVHKADETRYWVRGPALVGGQRRRPASANHLPLPPCIAQMNRNGAIGADSVIDPHGWLAACGRRLTSWWGQKSARRQQRERQ